MTKTIKFTYLANILLMSGLFQLLALSSTVSAAGLSQATRNISRVTTTLDSGAVNGSAETATFGDGPKLAEDGLGNIHMAWEQACNDATDADCVLYWNSGSPNNLVNLSAKTVTGTETTDINNYTQDISIAADSAGNVGVAWVSVPAGGTSWVDNNAYVWLSSDANTVRNISESSTAVGTAPGAEYAIQPKIVTQNTNVFDVFWSEYETASTDQSVFYWTSTANTTVRNISESSNPIGTAPVPSVLQIRAISNGSGGSYVSWTGGGFGDDVYFWYNANVNDVYNISESSNPSGSAPSGMPRQTEIILDSGGNAAIAFNQNDAYYWNSSAVNDLVNLSEATPTGTAPDNGGSYNPLFIQNVGTEVSVVWAEYISGDSSTNMFYWDTSSPTAIRNLSSIATGTGTMPAGVNDSSELNAHSDGTNTGVVFQASDDTDRDAYFWNSSDPTNLENISEEVTISGNSPDGDAYETAIGNNDPVTTVSDNGTDFVVYWSEFESFYDDLYEWTSGASSSSVNISESRYLGLSSSSSRPTEHIGMDSIVTSTGPFLSFIGNSISSSNDVFVRFPESQGFDATVNQKVGQADPSSDQTIFYTVTFDEPINVSSFTDTDLTLSVFDNSAGGGGKALGDVSAQAVSGTIDSITEVAPNDGTTFEVQITADYDTLVYLNLPEATVEYVSSPTALNAEATKTDNIMTISPQATACGVPPAGYNVIESDAATINGTDGDDFICAGSSNNTIYAKGGDDIVYGKDGDDRIIGGTGDDKLVGDNGRDSLYGQDGLDLLYGKAGIDYLVGGNDKDRMLGGDDTDFMYGQLGNDVMYGEEGNDKMIGDAGIDYMFGGNGIDYMYGRDHNDRMYGQGDKDKMFGENGNDTMVGGTGRDYMKGGSGTDKMAGGGDRDIVTQ